MGNSSVHRSFPTSFEQQAVPDGGSLESELCGSGETVRLTPNGVAYLVDTDSRHTLQLEASLFMGAATMVGAAVMIIFCGLAGSKNKKKDQPASGSGSQPAPQR